MQQPPERTEELAGAALEEPVRPWAVRYGRASPWSVPAAGNTRSALMARRVRVPGSALHGQDLAEGIGRHEVQRIVRGVLPLPFGSRSHVGLSGSRPREGGDGEGSECEELLHDVVNASGRRSTLSVPHG